MTGDDYPSELIRSSLFVPRSGETSLLNYYKLSQHDSYDIINKSKVVLTQFIIIIQQHQSYIAYTFSNLFPQSL